LNVKAVGQTMNAKRSPLTLEPARTHRTRRTRAKAASGPVVRSLSPAPLTGFDDEPHTLVVRSLRPASSVGQHAYFVELHLEHRRVVLRNSLAEVLKTLPNDLMCQVNRSQAVNIRHLDLIGSDEVRIGELAFTLSKHFREPLLGSVRIIAGR
jgi:hypothetical protein